MNRPLLFACFVSSIDCSIAFKNNPKSSQIVRSENSDPGAGQADLWILNLLRAAADGIILGPKTLEVESNLTAHVFDQDLVTARSNLMEKPEVPYNIIISKTGQSIPYQHRIFNEEEIPLIIATSPHGAQHITKNLDYPLHMINLTENNYNRAINLRKESSKIILLVTGDDEQLDEKKLFKFLKKAGLDRIMVEAPSYAHYLIQQHLLDELFLNQTGSYIGEPKFLNSDSSSAFSVGTEPQAKMITIHTYNSYFFCFRYRFIY
ncbi:MAG: dihydrofolate reductase family protein [Halanaerobacter sp.]